MNQVVTPRIDPRQPVKKRILAYNKLLLKQSAGETENIPTPRPLPLLPPLSSASPKRKLVLDVRDEPALEAAQRLPNLEREKTELANYSFLKELNAAHEKVENVRRSNTCSVIVRRGSVAGQERNVDHVQEACSNNKQAASKSGKETATSSDRWDGALALMQLAASPPSRKSRDNSFE